MTRELANALHKGWRDWEEANLNQGRRVKERDYAEHLGVRPDSFSQWKNNLRNPDPENLAQLAKVYGMRVYDLAGVQPPMPDDPVVREFLYKFLVLDNEDRARAMQFVDDLKDKETENEAA